MIRNTYLHLQKIGDATQRRIRATGISSWDDFIATPGIPFISPIRKEAYDFELANDLERLASNDDRYFAKRLKPREHWRLFDVFRDDVAYLDIETTGGGPYDADLTVVGIYRHNEMIQLVNGHNLSGDTIDEALAGVKLLITFFGSAFDVPFIKAKYSWLDFGMPHFDLCFAGKRVGLRGGLKSIEKQLGIERGDEVEGLTGYEAVLLWEAYKRRNDKSSLERLLEYNRSDVLNMEILANVVYNRLVEGD